ncbi:MAG TPA: AsmA family protein [Pseudacidobacterium sp.]|nr:AsmA family protein [Pseudacidobacterium sp.]
MSEAVRKPRTRYWILFAALSLLAIALVLPPLINMNRYQRQIADAISRGLGRPVHLSSVTLRLLPRPDLELSNFVVEEDPAFGAEPALRAPSVDAAIRISSLWRGRLEIGRISLDQPSVNLVRNSEGHWNLGTILLQASHIPNAPTTQRRASQSPRFPYIEASNARVNFKIGAEKKPFSFLNADFAMWLAEPDEWRIRLEAQPVRTDLDLGLSDTGTMRVEGSLKRAAELGAMPINLHAEWSNAPLGQISRLLFGIESGWRANLEVTGDVTGSVFEPQFKTRIRIAGMHRQEFSPIEPFNVDATCQGGYQQPSHSITDLTCFWPIDAGHLLLTGNIPDIEHPVPALQLRIQNVPATFGLAALRLTRNGFAGSAQVTGRMQGTLDYRKQLTGNLTVNGLSIRTPEMNVPLLVPVVHIVADGNAAPTSPRTRKKQLALSASTLLRIENTSLSLGGATPLTIAGSFTPSAFTLHFNGNASITDLRPVAIGVGLLPNVISPLTPQGEAEMDLTVRSPWLPQVSASDGPTSTTTTEGTLRLKNAEFRAGFLSGPVEITSAQAAFSPEQIIWEPVTAVFQKIPVTLSATMPVHCSDQACVYEFSLTTPDLDAAVLQSALLGADEHNELLQLLARLDRNKPQWPVLNGTVHVSTFALGPLAIHDASSQLRIEGRTIQFLSIDGHTLNGTVHATGTMDASGSTPHYSFDAQLTHANAIAVSNLWHGQHASGTVSVNTQLEMSGYSADDLSRSAQGTFSWDWTQGALTDGPDELTRFDHWKADGAVKNAKLVLDRSQVTKGATKSGVAGTISFDRKLNLTVTDLTEQAQASRKPSQSN